MKIRTTEMISKKAKDDLYYLGIAKACAANCKCLSRKLGAILVNPSTNSVIGTGYNGPPLGTPHCNEPNRKSTLLAALKEPELEDLAKSLDLQKLTKCPRRPLGFKSGKGLEICVAAHAERNAILNAAKNGHKTNGSTLYCYCGTPCKDCAIELINAGIKRIVCLKQDRDYDDVARVLFFQANIPVDKYSKEKVDGKE